jgi:hypothetical protein
MSGGSLALGSLSPAEDIGRQYRKGNADQLLHGVARFEESHSALGEHYYKRC